MTLKGEAGWLDCAGANIDARLSRRGSGVWFNRPDSKSGEPNGSGGSNPSLSAKQSPSFAFSAEEWKLIRTHAHFLLLKGTGEACIRPSAADLCLVLSVWNRAAALPSFITSPLLAYLV